LHSYDKYRAISSLLGPVDNIANQAGDASIFVCANGKEMFASGMANHWSKKPLGDDQRRKSRYTSTVLTAVIALAPISKGATKSNGDRAVAIGIWGLFADVTTPYAI
jgi:hypothetical protein